MDYKFNLILLCIRICGILVSIIGLTSNILADSFSQFEVINVIKGSIDIVLVYLIFYYYWLQMKFDQYNSAHLHIISSSFVNCLLCVRFIQEVYDYLYYFKTFTYLNHYFITALEIFNEINYLVASVRLYRNNYTLKNYKKKKFELSNITLNNEMDVVTRNLV
ncbi:hypothetical protein A3Q56_00631 [Intoshia linei]|uniref:Transmembrane protein n=1 Tax=Intoshia linei TaxID=1819745 RepID=A0A177BBL7_9BILA|nr:hypothetical protein A3Q56_00631 [Intoshia linei]